ncbi:MAG: creatininase family protein [Chloroflexi bacterium CFX4]|nr:creatininase family protein [Chloroflexi bacterium CFX4]MDL1921252.1 creatininase family protein [Chloroflexi bacterium CFX3]
MRWEDLTGDQFEQAVAASQGVCLVPLSCIERHGHHAPLGTDMFIARAVCERAAQLEPVIIFPDFIFTQILEARHCIGTIAIQPELILQLLENICREIARNGMKKIVLVNAHGGNQSLLPFFLQSQLASQRDYVVYLTAEPKFATDHAGLTETSALLAIRPDLIHMAQVPSDGEGAPRQRLAHLAAQGILTGIWWYADHPTHYAGEALGATAEGGEAMLNQAAVGLANAIRTIKADATAKALQDAFYATTQHQ